MEERKAIFVKGSTFKKFKKLAKKNGRTYTTQLEVMLATDKAGGE